MLKRFALARRTGTYLRIIEEGTLEAGDRVEPVSRPAHQLTIADFVHAYLEDRSQLPRLLIPEVSESWRDWVVETAA
jgi:MOSC domain-containing protein YiiM